MEKVVNSWRYERKFLVESLSKAKIDAIVSMHPANFKEIFEFRYINNIYFDTEDLQFYHDNVDGCAERLKVRVRWYSDLYGNVLNPVLELKIKQGALGRKELYPLKGFRFGKNAVKAPLKVFMENADIPDIIKAKYGSLRPKLINRYGRTYFMSDCAKFRLTIDSELSYRDTSSKNQPAVEDKGVTVIELKYSDNDDEQADLLSGKFPFEVTKSSKYVMGIERICG